MVLVLGLMSASLGVSAYSRATIEHDRVGNLVARVVQEWILSDPTLQRREPPSSDTWVELSRKLSGSPFFYNWVIVDSTGTVVARDANVENWNELAANRFTTAALRNKSMRVDADRVYFPLQLPTDVGLYAMTCDISRLVVPESYIADTIKNVLGIMALGTVLVVLMIFILLGRLLRPLELLIVATDRVAQGDYTQPVPRAEGPDEISTLVGSFNSMMEGLRKYHGTLEANIHEAREEIKRTQQGLVIAQRLTATGQLAAGVAHEINNPLGGLINAARTLRSKPDMDPARRDQYLDLIGEGLGRIQEIVRQLLQFSPRRTEPQTMQAVHVIHRALALVQHKLDKRAIAVDDRLPADLPLIYGDPSELQQVFVNLIINAGDAIEDSTGMVAIWHEVRGDHLVLVIEDTGCGMTEEELNKAFDIFYTTKPAGQGTGIGLAVVSNILQNHGGRIEMESRKGIGTKAYVVLPIRQTGTELLPAAAQIPHPPPAPQDPPAAPPRQVPPTPQAPQTGLRSTA